MIDRKRTDFGVFLDLDGCWADTEPGHWASWKDALLPYGVTLGWEDYCENAIGHSDKEILEQYVKRIAPSLIPTNPEAILEKKLEIYLDFARKNPLVPKQNVDLINRLGGFKIALVTTSTRAEVDAVLYGTGLKAPFKIIVSLDDVMYPKPNPEPYLNAKKQLGVSSGIAFEDSESGIKSATSAGLEVIKVTRPLELSRLVQDKLGVGA